jgi:ariadne-1
LFKASPVVGCADRYEAAWKKGEYNEAHKRRENAKNSLERYMHFYERYSAHDRARKKAMEDQALHSEGTAMMERLSGLTKIPTSQLKFISDAWAQVVDCRRILKWTYAYGYYKYDNDDLDEVGRQKEFFEFLQVGTRLTRQLHCTLEEMLLLAAVGKGGWYCG